MEKDFINLTRSCLVLCMTAGMAFTAHAQNESVQDILTGRFSGVQVLSDDGAPGAAFSVRIRGLRGLRGDSQPLYVLDGVILNSPTVDADKTFWSDGQDYQSLQSTLDHINPADIENIEILKDGAATAIYGSMGGNGVVIITTKHGKSGKPALTWNSTISLSDKMTFSHRHHVSAGGGEKAGTYYLSAGYSSLNGTIDNSGLENASVNAKYDQNFGKDSRFGVSLAFGMRDNDMVMSTSPLGSNSTIKSAWSVSPNPSEPEEIWLKAYDDNSRQYSVDPRFYIDASLGLGFKLKANAGLDFRNKTRYRWVGSDLERAAAIKGEAGQSNATAIRYNINAALDYSFDSNGHDVDVSVGGGYYGCRFMEYIYEGQTFFSQDLRAPGISIAEKVAPYRHLDNNNLTAAVFAKLDYNYKNRYFFGASARKERLHKYESFGQGGFYPSVNVGWDVAKEAFMSSQSVLSTLKLTIGAGVSGTQDLNQMGYASLQEIGPVFESEEGKLSNYYDVRYVNTTLQHNVGIDFGFLSDRIRLSVEAYKMRSEDKLNYYYHELKGEYVENQHNSASVCNKGIDIAFSGLIVDKKDLRWSVGMNFSYNTNEITDISFDGDIDGLSVGELGGQQLVVNKNRLGESVASFYGYKSQGSVDPEHTLLAPAFDGNRLKVGDVKFIDVNGDGNVTAEDQTIIGNPLPHYLAGFNTNFSYKRFSLDLNFDGAFDFDVANLRKFYSDPDFDMSSATGLGVFSSRLVEDASYVRLSNISLSYDYSFTKVKFLDSVRFTLAAKNLLTITNYSGSAPYVNSYGYDLGRLGVDNGAYPAFKSFILGMTLRF